MWKLSALIEGLINSSLSDSLCIDLVLLLFLLKVVKLIRIMEERADRTMLA